MSVNTKLIKGNFYFIVQRVYCFILCCLICFKITLITQEIFSQSHELVYHKGNGFQ